MMMKREYRGQRSVTAIADYIRQQKSNPIREVQDLEEINTADVSILIFFLLNMFVFCFMLNKGKIMYLKYMFNTLGIFHSEIL